MREVTLAIALFVVWTLLAWPADGQDLAAGVVVAAAVALLVRRTAQAGFAPWLKPSRYLWLAAYVFVLAWAIVKANFDVAYRLLHPDLPIRPGIVKVRSSLKSPSALTALANSITLTPGTLTVGVTEDGVLYVHCIWVDSTDVEEATRRIVRPFERFIQRIWE